MISEKYLAESILNRIRQKKSSSSSVLKCINSHEISKVTILPEKYLMQVLDSMDSLVIWAFAPGSPNMLYISPSIEKLSGHTNDYYYKNSEAWIDLIHPDDIELMINTILSGNPRSSCDFRMIRADGEIKWTRLLCWITHTAKGSISRLNGILTDISQEKLTKEIVKISEARYRAVVEDQTELICRFTKDTTLTFVNEAYCRYFRKTPEQLIGYPFLCFIPEEDHQAIKNTLSSLSLDQPLITYEHKVIDQQGQIQWQQWTDRALYDEHGQFLEFQSVGRNITKRVMAEQALQNSYKEMEIRVMERTADLAEANKNLQQEIEERKEIESKLRNLALNDPLTGLYNRTYFEEELYSIETTAKGNTGLLLCDLDGLKFTNNTLGHQSGNILLKTAARIIKESIRDWDKAARIGGDEFAVAIYNCSEALMNSVYHRIKDKVSQHNNANPRLPLSISMGFAIREDHLTTIYDLFKTADNNMHRAKLYHDQSSRSSVLQTLMKALNARDFITEGHVDRLQQVLLNFAIYLDLPVQSVTDMRLLAQFHDIGKVGIPDYILFKPGPLTTVEKVEMQRHSEIGYRIAMSSPDLAPIAEWILKHHEWWNGKGYPLGLQGEDIPLACRLLTIADAYDAMTNDRPYRKAVTQQEAVLELQRCAGSQFDPHLVPRFIHLLDTLQMDCV